MPLALTGKGIVITRPRHQAESLAGLMAKMGGKPILFPTLEILPVENNQNLLAAFTHLNQYEIAIFVSANAVHHALSLPHPPLSMTIIAIGNGTASALNEYQISADWIPESHHSEGLLALPILNNCHGKKIAIFCGENARPLLSHSLKDRGAVVDELICYRRRCPSIDAELVMKQWQLEPIGLIISTSVESLKNLWQLFKTVDEQWLLSISLLVISPTMAAQAKKFGFRSVIVANGASDQAIGKALIEAKQKTSLLIPSPFQGEG